MNVEVEQLGRTGEPHQFRAGYWIGAARAPGLSWPVVLGIAALWLIVGTGWGLVDPDPYWQIRLGEWILSHHQVPTWDLFSYSMPGAPFTTQEWGSEVIVALTYHVAGWAGLLLLSGAVFALTLSYVARFLLNRVEPLYAVAATSMVGVMIAPMCLPRPHTLVWPLLAVWASTLLQSAAARRSPPWWLLPVIWLWTNLHGSFIFGLALIVPFALDCALEARNILTQADYRRLLRHWALFFIAACLCVLLNPVGYHALLFPFHMLAMGPMLAIISEWHSPDFSVPQPLMIWLLTLIALGFAGRWRVSWVRGALLLGLIAMALQHQRNIPLLALTSVFILGSGVRQRNEAVTTDDNVIDRVFRRMALPAARSTALVAALGAFIVASIVITAKHPKPVAWTPAAAVDALQASGVRGPVLNDYNFGGYLIFRGIPVFIDSRADMYGQKFVLDNMDKFGLSKPGFEDLLEKYHIQSTLLPVTAPAARLLDHLPGWQRLYADDTAVVHVRTSLP